ncbi:nuclear transport factor 2 family protein [Granulicella sp. dw_53]|uniref:YybH family protein n=1 Tax=Granulicella sp. dw_53 TaxID=2719792 RepID=UPI001BD559D1|nr:nuclear transport factor 2 family protein [Granulicella sp. dw_53]
MTLRLPLPHSLLRLLLIAVLFTSASTLLHAQPDPLHTASPEELAIVKVLLAQETAWNRGDIDGFAQGYKDSPDTLFLTHQISRSYAGLVDQYHRDYPTKAAMGTLSFSELEVHPLDDRFAVCIGKYELERGKKEGGHAEGLFSLVFEKTDKGWKIIIDHTT